MSETEEDLQRYIRTEQNPLVIGLARALLDARAEIERLRDALRPMTSVAGRRVLLCNVCGGPWDLERPRCNVRGACRGGYIVTPEQFNALSTPPTEESRDE